MLRKLLAFVSVLMLVSVSNVIAGKGSRSEGDPSTLSEEEIHHLEYMREEEKLARDSYITLYGLWENPVFFNISESEQQHTDAIEKLLDKYGLPDPVVDETNVGDFVDPELQTLFDELMDKGEVTELAALYVGAEIEETDILDIQDAIDATDNADIENTYKNLLCGSQNHLRAFIWNIELEVPNYEPIHLTADQLEDIVNGQMEDCN